MRWPVRLTPPLDLATQHPARRLTKWIEAQGYTVYVTATLPPDVQGRTDYSNRTVHITRHAGYGGILLALAHEAGHIAHVARLERAGCSIADVSTFEREAAAYRWGWALLRRVDHVGGQLIYKHDWQLIHAFARGMPDPHCLYGGSDANVFSAR